MMMMMMMMMVMVINMWPLFLFSVATKKKANQKKKNANDQPTSWHLKRVATSYFSEKNCWRLLLLSNWRDILKQDKNTKFVSKLTFRCATFHSSKLIKASIVLLREHRWGFHIQPSGQRLESIVFLKLVASIVTSERPKRKACSYGHLAVISRGDNNCTL